LVLDIQMRLHDNFHALEIANEEVSEVVEFGWHIGVFGTVIHVTQGLDVEHERIKENKLTPPTSLDHGVQLIPWLP